MTGGYSNTASGIDSTVTGGGENKAQGSESAILGGGRPGTTLTGILETYPHGP